MSSRSRMGNFVRLIFAAALMCFAYAGGPILAADSFESLQAEIAAANSGNGDGIIRLGGNIVLSAALPPITGELVVEGGGHSISGDGQYRIFDVAGGRLGLIDVTLTEGQAPADENGGAIQMQNGAGDIIVNASFMDNLASNGGAIAMTGNGNSLIVNGSSFVSNRAEKNAGGILADGGTLQISDSRFEKNCAEIAAHSVNIDLDEPSHAPSSDDGCPAVHYVWPRAGDIVHVIEGQGGAIHLRHGAQASIVDSTFASNKGTEGGAVATNGADVRLIVSDSSISGNKAKSGGGAVYVAGGTVDISGNSFRDNNAGWGGAIATTDASARLSVSDSRFAGNIAEKSAGAIYAGGGTVNIVNSEFEKNCAQFAFFSLAEGVNSERHSVDAEGCHRARYVRSQIEAELQSHVDGGAIRLLNGAQVSIEDSSFSGNSATYGGAVSTASKDVELSVSGSSFTGNRASGSGGAIGASWTGGGRISVSGSSFVKNSTQEGDGGAIETTYSKLDIVNSTFSANEAGDDGGAVKINENAEVTIAHSTFVDNWSDEHQANAISKTGGKAWLRNSIVASEADGEDCVGAWEHVGNLSTDGTCGDRPGDNPRLGDLTGSPAYYPLRDRSPAVDYADPEFCLETDQVGTPRPQGGACDIGAIEARGVIAAEPTRVPPLVCTLAYQIVAANRDWRAGGCEAGSGVDTIVLDKDIILFEPLPAIASHIIIEGNGHSISGEGKFRIFDVDGGILTIRNLTMIDGNASNGNGGAIRLQNGGRAIVSDSRFVNNSAGYGGAIYLHLLGTRNSWLTVERSSFLNNSGNAIYAGGDTVSVSGSSFIGNSGRYSVIQVLNPMRLDVTNSSFIKNYSPAVSAENGATANITHVTIDGAAIRMPKDSFTAFGRVNLRNSIIADRAAPSYCDKLTQNIGNLIKAGDCRPALSGDPMLEKATDASAYLELQPGSPAINAADARFCPDTDQLGRARSIVGRCDIGAIEAVPASRALSNCFVTTTHLLNLRDGPGGAVIGGVPQNMTLRVLARTPRWFEVDVVGASGWISADYVTPAGECG